MRHYTVVHWFKVNESYATLRGKTGDGQGAFYFDFFFIMKQSNKAIIKLVVILIPVLSALYENIPYLNSTEGLVKIWDVFISC